MQVNYHEVPLHPGVIPSSFSTATSSSSSSEIVRCHDGSWFSQYYWCLWKNGKLLSRRPIMFSLVLMSGFLSIFLSWIYGRDPRPEDVIYPPADAYSDCGTLQPDYVKALSTWNGSDPNMDPSKVQLSLNDRWRDGYPVFLMALSPLLHSIFAFLVLRSEFEGELVSLLQKIGLRDSVYWVAWYTPFCMISFFSSFTGAITAHLLPGHVYDNVFFGGIFVSLLLFHLSFVAFSFFLASVCGRSNRLCSLFAVLLIILLSYLPFLMCWWGSNWGSSHGSYGPSGLFWEYDNTLGYDSDFFDFSVTRLYHSNMTNSISDEKTPDYIEYDDVPTEAFEDHFCHHPLVSEFQGKWYKTEEERKTMGPEGIFIGCYVRASWSFMIWKREKQVARRFLFFSPYFHFMHIWGSFIGFTSKTNRTFTYNQMFLSQEDLAIDALPAQPDPARGGNSSFAAQGSMFILHLPRYDYDNWRDNSSFCPWVPRPDFPDLCEEQDSCLYIVDPGPMVDAPSVMDTMGHMIALTIIYLVLAGYWVVAFSDGSGKLSRWFFFVFPEYWRNDSKEYLIDNDGDTNSVIIDNIKKWYGYCPALNGVTFRMNTGEVTALLGHNGAGKTTLSNILCCETPATSGDIYVFGHSVTAKSFLVRNMVGLCRQDDYLWPDLSAREHLEFFAGLRGIDSRCLEDTVQKCLEGVDLAGVQNHYSSGYSGGMRRRLSLALATIGDPPLIVLDEPTTGMDPVSRRFVWRHINSIKKDKVILLTTHDMEEADLLADEVVLMKKGEVAALGSPLELKKEYGSALRFSLLMEKSKTSEIAGHVRDFFAADYSDSIRVESSKAGTISVQISAMKENDDTEGVEVTALTDFVRWLDSGESDVVEYIMSNSSLEEVFLKVTDGGVRSEFDDGEGEGQFHDTSNEMFEEGGIGVEDRSFNRLGSVKGNLSSWNQCLVIWKLFLLRGWTGRPSAGNYLVFGFLPLGASLHLGVFPFMKFIVVISFMTLIVVISPVYSDRSDGQLYLMQSQGLLPSGYIGGLSLYAFSVTCVYNLLALSLFFVLTSFGGFEQYDLDGGTLTGMSFVQVKSTKLEYLDNPVRLSSMLVSGGYGMIVGIAVVGALPMVGYALCTAFLPGHHITLAAITFGIVVFSTLPLMGLFSCTKARGSLDNCVFAKFTIDTVGSQFVDCTAYEMMPWYDAAYICSPPMASLLSPFGIYQMLNMLYGYKIQFSSDQTGYIEDVLIPALQEEVHCEGQTCTIPLASRLYKLYLLHTILGGFVFILLGLCVVYFLGFPVAPVIRFREFVIEAVLLRLNEWKEAVVEAGCDCFRKKPQHNEQMSNFEVTGLELTDVSEDRPTFQNVVQPLLNVNTMEPLELTEVTEERTIVDNLVQPLLTSYCLNGRPILRDLARRQQDDVPPIVAHKLRKVYPARGGCSAKVALDSLDLHVPKGQILGLLGRNGAGKSTALKILSGAHDSCSGIGLVAGYDCNEEKMKIFERLGNCAQSDVIWTSQSVQSHLEFFVSLKGLPKSEIKSIARAMAIAVGLGSNKLYTRLAGSLSGGMRRRLSIGIALIGSPSVVILDEPTTGLDPSTRSSIWSMIRSFATDDRSMIITTHMMNEADTLCDRIAIVNDGKLVVIGTQQYLKKKYSDGYVLHLNLVENCQENQERAMNFVRKYLHAHATLGIRQTKTLNVHLPRDTDLEQVFRTLCTEEKRVEGGIRQFLLSQSSLEDVFVAVTE